MQVHSGNLFLLDYIATLSYVNIKKSIDKDKRKVGFILFIEYGWCRVCCGGVRQKSFEHVWKMKSLFWPFKLKLCLLSGSVGHVYRVCLDEGVWQTKENSTDIWRDSSECSEKNHFQKNVSMFYITVENFNLLNPFLSNWQNISI